MKGMMIRCVRCKGRKKMYKMGSAYSHTNSGGEEVTCPMCLGEGSTKSLADAIEALKLNAIDKPEATIEENKEVKETKKSSSGDLKNGSRKKKIA